MKGPRRISREAVYDAINEERDYQDIRWEGHKHEVAAYLLFMQGYLNKAIAAISTEEGDHGGLDYLRKVVGLGVCCMEENGAVRRLPRYPAEILEI